jgi:hypothetical protein
MRNKTLPLGVLVFAAALAVASAQSPTRRDISSWTIYRNETMGFETKYPSNWHLRTVKGSGPETILIEEPPQFGQPHLAVQFWIQRQANPQGLPIDHWYADQLHAMKAVPPPISNTSIGGRPALRIEAVGKLGTSFQFFTTLNRTNIFEITMNQPSSQRQLDRIYQDVVASIRFID